MAYTIKRQSSTGLWVVEQDGVVLGRGEAPQTAINFAIQKGMPAEERSVLLDQYDTARAKEVEEFNNRAKESAATEPVQTAQQNNQYNNSDAADDDRGNTPGNTGDTAVPTSNPVNNYSETTDTSPTPAPTTNAVSTNNTSTNNNLNSGKGKEKPGRRTKNPLSNFSSYTYQATLYMITPEAYRAYIESGRKNVNVITSTGNSGSYIVAQSAGINSSNNQRATPYDYYIDDIKIKLATSGKATSTATNVESMSFSIIEPYGFSFISELKQAASTLARTSGVQNYADLQNPTRQFFILGIRFFGYDKNGKVVTPADLSSLGAGEEFQTSAESNGLFERFYDIFITDMKFKIDGKSTVYQLTAAATSLTSAMGVKLGRIDPNMKILADNVEEALNGENGLMKQLTKFSEAQSKATPKGRQIPNKYSVKFIGNSDLIKNASILTEADRDKSRWRMSRAKSIVDVNPSLEVKESPDNTKRLVTFKTDTPILQAISAIISQSSYLDAALNKLYTTNLQPNQSSDSPDVIDESDQGGNFNWYTVGTEIKCLGYDKLVNDWAYDITYIIQPYEAPNVVTPYVNKTAGYPGPYKRYSYYFTGENSEISNFELKYDNLYFQVALAPSEDPRTHGWGANNPTVPGKRPDEDRTGKPLFGKDAQNTALTSLYDPGAYVNAKMTILGDPDYMAQSSPSSVDQVYSQYYGIDGFTLNPNGTQCFIEVDFKEPVDYKHDKGLLDINSSILFYKYPDSVKNQVKGISFQLLTVDNVFSKGKFTQTLSLTINQFPNAKGNSSSREETSTPTTGTDVRDASGRLNATNDPRSLTYGYDASGRANADTDPRSLTSSVRTVTAPTNYDNTSNSTVDTPSWRSSPAVLREVADDDGTYTAAEDRRLSSTFNVGSGRE